MKHGKSFVLSLIGASVLVGTTGARAGFGDPVSGLTADQQARFVEGQEVFQEVEDASDGLGPVFNEASCATCHIDGGVGGGSDRVETRFGKITNGAFDPLANEGGSLMQDHAIGLANGVDFVPEVVPGDATIVAGRRTTPLFGLGLVDAVPDPTFRDLARREAFFNRRTAGRVANVTNIATGQPAVGKFGWKAQVPSLQVFAGDAYLNEMGITSPLFPNENCPQGDCTLLAANPRPDLNDDGTDVALFADFMTFLAPPPGPARSRSVAYGAALFAGIGCTDCHTPALQTGRNDVAALSRKTFFPYSDFLLHDMGTLGDGIAQGDAGQREMRTAPLWGLSKVTVFLHDGRTTSVEAAILAHDGQGARAANRFQALRADQKQRLVSFLKSL